MSLLQAWLEKHKEYPRAARQRRVEGTVLLYFVVDRGGQVRADRIEKTSGHRLLDDEAEAMIKRANPLPPIPDAMNRDRLEIVVPVQFFLK
jgi:protein TonB